ncbi:mucin-2 [Leguminivora glycinivorella]|uniref:mucin-2 n=1 Tax=Leguminivora glycinivorella TaxID=1035111 RepID=UPI00200BF85B|nr:mucin-2 [Leguminivora glycinivorella]
MRGDRMMAPCAAAILTVLSLVALSNAGPLGPLPNVTSEDVGLKEGSCVVGDVVYMSGDAFTGATPCELCACAAGTVQCALERCEPRPGCKALHRPDHCCPTYQCECEQEGRVYGNGEKLVDPEDPCRVCYCQGGEVVCRRIACFLRDDCQPRLVPGRCCPEYDNCPLRALVDPCRVCYCQGGEVVCRRIACFLRDDCQPRLVPGRCCPEYDNCPLRGVTAIPGLPTSSLATTDTSNAVPIPPKENIKQEITIKEITPVSEIPVITDVKIKEILPSPSLEVPEYPSSKSPLIPREAIPDRSVTSAELSPTRKESVSIELISPLPTEQPSKPVEKIIEVKGTEDLLPSKISLSTQDSINSEIYPSHIPTIMATMEVPSNTPDTIPAASTTRVATIEEEDPSLFDHNPAFPPIPDDLSPVGTHEDDVSEQMADSDHINVHGEQHVASTLPPTSTTYVTKDTPTTTVRYILETSTTTTTTEKPATETTTITTKTPKVETAAYILTSSIPQSESLIKGSPMLNPWATIPQDILNVPSSMLEDINGELDDPEESVTAFEEPTYIATSTTTRAKLEDETTAGSLTLGTVKETILPKSNEEMNAPFDTTQSATSTTSGPVTKLDDTTTTNPQKVLRNKLPTFNEITSTLIDTTQSTQTVTSTTNGPVTKIVDNTAAPTISKEIILPRSGEVTSTAFDTTLSTQTAATTEKLITQSTQTVTSTTSEPAFKIIDETTFSPLSTLKNKVLPRSSEVSNTPVDTITQTTQKLTDAFEMITSTTKTPEKLTTGTVTKSNIPTEITAQTEFSSLPIETSDQNPHDSSESALKDKSPSTTETPLIVEITTAKATTETEEVTVAKTIPTTPSTPGSNSFENVDTTEFVSFGSSESSTDSVEHIKISPTQKVKNADIIDSSPRQQDNVLTALRDLVGDVVSISRHTDDPSTTLRTTTANSFSESEELMPVNAGYKSKNSNFNLNSITEIPLKTKSQLPVIKQKVVEIEGEDTDSIADAPPPHDKAEPTTRRPIIDNVSDSVPKNETDQKDIEIISQSYVPTINRRPTKVVMKKNNDKPLSEASTEQTLATASTYVVTSSEETTLSPLVITEDALSSEASATTADVTLGTDASTTAAQ